MEFFDPVCRVEVKGCEWASRLPEVGRSQGTRARIATGVSDWWAAGRQWWSYEAVRTA